MSRLVCAAALVATFSAMATGAQAQAPSDLCAVPDTIMVRGNVRTSRAAVIALSGLVPRREISGYTDVTKAAQAIFASGDYEDDLSIDCEVLSATRAAIVIKVRERPLLTNVSVSGAKTQSQRSVEDKVELLIGRAVDPSLVAKAIAGIDSLYQIKGYYLATITADTTVVDSAHISVDFRIVEGNRMAIAGLTVKGNKRVSAEAIAGVMKTRPEGWWWFRKGEFDDEKYAADLGERIPALFAERGHLDFQLLRDTVLVNREHGKGFIELEISEGDQYQIGTFTLRGNRHFTDEYLKRFYAFGDDVGLSLTQRAIRFVKRKHVDPNVFDNSRFDDIVQQIRTAYANDGYIYASINPVIERSRRPDSTPVVNMRLEINEQTPALINRVNIVGNTYTTEHCIRDVILIAPGAVYSQDLLIRSYQGLNNLGFFEAPIAEPKTLKANEQGDLDITFELKEKNTGNFSFGAQMGQGTGIGGFIQLEQPNLFGRCKRGSLAWTFGRYLNDFNLAYTDPAIKLSRISGTVNVYRSQARYQIADLGQTTRIGGTLRAGVPFPGSRFTRMFVSYTGESVKYGSGGLLGTVRECERCFRSAIGVDLTRESRSGMPFPFAGSLQSFSAEFNGGPLGGSADFQRYKTEYRAYAPIKEFGGGKMGTQPIIVTMGLSTRAGAVFGNTGPFFFSQRFALGGVQFGEPLRGYPEFSITPKGFLVGTSTYNAQRESFGSSFFATTAEIGVRFNAQFYANVFYDAGNVWETPREFNPTRLLRGAGVGLSTFTPLGLLGLDWAYGFDRLDVSGRRDPKWQLHFRLGQLF
jgi:outer membrane protein insertion porin family